MPIKWIEPQPVTLSEEIQRSYKDYFLLAEQLSKKGISSTREADEFFDPRSPRQASPFDFPDMAKAVERVIKAIKYKERIGIWGDFDADGQTATALLVDGLRKLGADVVYHIPVRQTESHGIKLEYLKDFFDQTRFQLFITCDTGISELKPIDYLSSNGIDAILTDHHTPTAILPQAFALINPRLLPDKHALSTLAGVGTAFQLISALFSRVETIIPVESYHDLVALGTIADVADLSGENRYYTKDGLRLINSHPRPAFSAIAKMSGFREAVINEMHVGFTFAPRLNAIGRLGNANPMVEFLTSGDENKVSKIAAQLEHLNNQRKLATDMVYNSALEQLENQKELLQYPVLVLHQEQWEKGVVGIAASRLAEKFDKPAILISTKNGETSGSARSVAGINIIQAIQENGHFLNGFGGHPMAAGLSIPIEAISAFREGLSKSVLQMSAGRLIEKALEIDAFLSLPNIGETLLLELEKLAPFGQGNPAPVIVTRNLEVKESAFIGKTREHRKLVVGDPQGNFKKVLWWNCADNTLPESQFDLAYYPHRDNSSAADPTVLEWLDHKATEKSMISIYPDNIRYRIQDYRYTLVVDEILTKLMDDPGAILWGEGNPTGNFPAKTRLELHNADTLVLLTPPPENEVLRSIVSTVNPSQIFLFSFSTIYDSMENFMRGLIGLVNYCFNHKNGKASLEQFASALGHSVKTITLGMEFLRTAGKISFELQNNDIVLERTGELKSSSSEESQSLLQISLNEAAAFRSYYKRCEATSLFGGI